MIGLIADPFGLPFMQRALVEVLLLGIVAGVVGVYVVLRRLAFVSDSLTHTVFPGVVIAAAFGQSLLLGALVAGVLTALLLTGLANRPRVSEDTALAVLLTSFFAVGVVVVSRQTSFTADLTRYLFGRLLTVDGAEIAQTTALGAVALAVLAALHKELVQRAFDPDGARAAGLPVAALDLVLNLVIALVVVAALKAVGTVLVIALVIVPAATARLLTDRLGVTFVLAAGLGALGGVLGLLGSFEGSVRFDLRLASGASVVVALIVLFVAALGFVGVRRRVRA